MGEKRGRRKMQEEINDVWMNGGMNERSAHLKLAFLCEKVMASWGKKSCFTCPGEMAQSLRYLLHRHGDQRYHSTKKDMCGGSGLSSQCWGGRQSWLIYWLTILLNQQCRCPSERLCLKQTRLICGRKPRWSSGLCLHTRACTSMTQWKTKSHRSLLKCHF